jgi:hypothetical protein
MTWGDVLDRIEAAGLKPVEELYMENYGKILAAQRPEFRDRYFRCTYGVVNCDGTRIEVFLFPESAQATEFLAILGADPWWFEKSNAVVHFSECELEIVMKVMDSLESTL